MKKFKKIIATITLMAMFIVNIVSPTVNVFAEKEVPATTEGSGRYTISIKHTKKTLAEDKAYDGSNTGARYEIVQKSSSNSKEIMDKKIIQLGEGDFNLKVDGEGVYEIKQISRAPGQYDESKMTQNANKNNTAIVEFPLLTGGKISSNQVFAINTKVRPIIENFSFSVYDGSKVLNSSSTNVDEKYEGLGNSEFVLEMTEKATVDNSGNITYKEINQDIKHTVKSNSDGLVKFEGLEEGNYIINEIKCPEGYLINNKPIKINYNYDSGFTIVNSDDFNNGIIVNFKKVSLSAYLLKDDNTEVEKLNINTENSYTNRLKINAPGDIGEYSSFKLVDKIDNNLKKCDANDIKRIYTLDKSNKETDIMDKVDIKTVDGVIQIDFDKYIKNCGKKDIGCEDIIVEYNTHILGKSCDLENIENQFSIEWNNGKGSEAVTVSNKTYVNPITVNISGIKTDRDKVTKLSGAEFKIFEAKNAPKNLEEAMSEDAPKFINPNTGLEVANTISDEEGNISFEKLPYGDYIIYEVKAPESYRIKTDGIKVNMTDNKDLNNQLEENSKGNLNIGEIVNISETSIMPNTGTAGTLVIMLATAGAIACGYAIKSKNNKEDN